MGLGFIALRTAAAIDEGKSMKEVVDVARSAIPVAHAIFVVDTLEFLHRRGRIGGASRLLGSLVSLKPLLYLEDGLIEPLAKVRTKKKALQAAIDYVANDIAGRGSVNAAILHAASPDEAELFKADVIERLQLAEISVHQLTPVLGANTGPGLVGIAYITEN